MKRVLTAAVLIPVVLVLVFLGPRWQWLFTLVTAIVAALASWEYLTLARQKGAEAPRLAVTIAILALFAATFQWPDQVASILGILSLALLLICTFSSPIARVLPDASNAVFCLLYAGFIRGPRHIDIAVAAQGYVPPRGRSSSSNCTSVG